ncbi:DUF4942 domain-containing protein [Yersinia wautersii]|uniref:DUF4942 domain-containing protein n=1 Tax=Yersinia wautersii TaxID=1341643 RepID=UPI00040EECC8|nr:DUF4942 domain-containing protein [Yersinia wautersii]
MTFTTDEQATTDHTNICTDASINPTEGGELIPSASIDRIIAFRKQGLETYAQAIALFNESQKIFESATGGSFHGLSHCVTDAMRWGSVKDNSEKLTRLLDAKIWHKLMNDTGMYTFMSSTQRDQWSKELDSDKMPAVTLDNVLATFKHLLANKQDTFEQGIVDVFRSLSWDYKTNNPCKIGKKIIIEGMIDGMRYNSPSITTRGRTKIDDLTKACDLLDKKNTLDHRSGTGSQFAEWFRQESWGSMFTSDYFSLRVFKKGSCHVVFSRMDLVDEMNAIVARQYPNMLPPRV